MPSARSYVAAAILALAPQAAAQTFQRLGGCPTLGCIFPPDQADFLPGAYFDIRTEVHAIVNGTSASPSPNPDKTFTLTIAKQGRYAENAAQYFKLKEPAVETWNFTYFEDLFARDASTPTAVNVAGKAYRKVTLTSPGTYTVTLSYNGGKNKTVATWFVKDIPSTQKAKNVLLFIGDGMTTNMITAARLIGHKMINGKYQSTLQMDKFPVVGHQMTHSLDSYITDSANSATALYTGHKSTVNALGVYADSSPDQFDDPKVENLAELFNRQRKGGVGIVSTAFIADATPAGLSAHTRYRDNYGQIVDTYLHGQTNYSWSPWSLDVLFGGGAEQFYPNPASFNGSDYFSLFKKAGYNVAQTGTELSKLDNSTKALGIFCKSNMAKWLDRNVYKGNLYNNKDFPDGKNGSAYDQPGLKEMTLKGLEILSTRHKKDGWFMMSEAASIDKMMHVLDYDRALGDLLELDDTVKASMAYLKSIGELENTLIVVTADHGHGFDVTGSVDTKYLVAQSGDRQKRSAIGTYQNSGESQYVIPDPSTGSNDTNLVYKDGTSFPANWDPRYTLQSGVGAFPDHHENYKVHKNGPRVPAVGKQAYANPADPSAANGFLVNGTLPMDAVQGVHSLTDVAVFAEGPCQELFGGVYSNIDIFFKIAQCAGLSRRT